MSYIGNPIISTDFPKDTFSGNGSTTAFTMAIAPASVNAVIVVVSGITQDPSTYTISGTTLTFSAAPPSGTSNISVRHLGIAGSPQVPAIGSVVSASLATADLAINGVTVGKGGGAVASNTAVGSSALNANTSGTENAAFGKSALLSNTSASANSAFGTQALYSNTTGANNTAAGQNSLISNTTGAENAAFGKSALNNNSTAGNNSAFGCQSMYNNTTGTNNVSIGHNTMIDNTTGNNNVAVGETALRSNTTASYNTAVGYQAGNSCTTNGANTLIGANCGTTLTTGTNNTYLGAGATASAVGVAQEIVICAGNGATGKGSNTAFVSANSGAVYNGYNSASWQTTSDRRLKKNIVDNNTGLDIINAIQVRNFEYRLPDEITELNPSDAINRSGTQIGVIAQEIQQVSQEFVKTESTGVMSVDTDNLVWYLVNAVKELKAELDQLKGN